MPPIRGRLRSKARDLHRRLPPSRRRRSITPEGVGSDPLFQLFDFEDQFLAVFDMLSHGKHPFPVNAGCLTASGPAEEANNLIALFQMLVL